MLGVQNRLAMANEIKSSWTSEEDNADGDEYKNTDGYKRHSALSIA